MRERRFTTNHGYDAIVNLASNHAGTRGGSIMFAPHSSTVVAETHGDVLYVDYCFACIVASELHKLGVIAGVDMSDTVDAMYGRTPCACDDDDDDDDDSSADTTYVAQLSESERARIAAALAAVGVTGDDLEAALSSRVCDLADVLAT